MKLACLTPTGDRPEAFALCHRFMERQTLRPYLWFITDDGVNETQLRYEPRLPIVSKRLPQWDKPGHSQHRNMLELLAVAEESDADAFVIVEDDDYYGPKYLEACERHLATADLIGEIPAKYYNVRTRHWREFQNTYHASLCQTAFRRSMIQPLRDVIATGQMIDMTFWPKYLSRGRLWEGRNVVGMKSMPGRGGVSDAHRKTASWGHADPNLEKLREWIGNDAALYAGYVDSELVSQQQQPIWCASCGMATVAVEGDVCSRCSAAGAGAMQCETFVWNGVTQYRCPEHPRCRYNTSSLDTMAEHLKGCTAREAEAPAPANVGRGLFDARGNRL